MKNQVSATYLFPNDMVATFDQKGNQIGELQGRYSRELHIKILKASSVQTLFKGFPMISMHEPTFSRDEAIAYARLCQTDEEIHELRSLVLFSQVDRYEYPDLRDIDTAITRQSSDLTLGRMLSKMVSFRMDDRIWIDPLSFV